MNIDSTTCFSKKTGKPRKEFYSNADALRAAEHAENEYGNKLISYRCKKCDYWHLSPLERQTPCKKCWDCIDANGEYKMLYNTYKDAKKRADILMKEQEVKLSVYQCPYREGWHLTKKQNF